MVNWIYRVRLNQEFWSLPGVPRYDVTTSVVVVASSEQEARELANAEGMDEIHCDLSTGEYVSDNKAWTMEKYTIVERFGTADHDKPVGVILRQSRDG